MKIGNTNGLNLYYPCPEGLVTDNGWIPSLCYVTGDAAVLGAQIRCTEAGDQYSGIRFVSVFKKDKVEGAQTADANFGIILIAKNNLNNIEGAVTVDSLVAAGGINMIKSMAAPYQQIMFMPTGGINEDNMLDYLSFGKIIACGGSFMVKDALIDAGNFEEITRLTRNAVMKMLGFKLVHIGINCESSDEAQMGAKLICSMFGLDCKVGNSSTFAGSEFEFMHSQYLGTHGHIAIATNFPDRAKSYLEGMGIEFNEETAKYDAKGNLTVIYLKGEVCGFAIHLVKKK
jgi:hypothetical protein